MNSEELDCNDRNYIESRIRSKPQPDEDKILKYLGSGNRFAEAGAYVTDVFSREKNWEGIYTYTDGEWLWDNTLTYYVENYHFQISNEFVAHMKKNNWKVPKLTEEELEKHFGRW